MEAEFKFTQHFVTPLVGILLKKAQIWHLAQKVSFSNHFNTHFQQYTCWFASLTAFPITFGQILIFEKSCNIALTVRTSKVFIFLYKKCIDFSSTILPFQLQHDRFDRGNAETLACNSPWYYPNSPKGLLDIFMAWVINSKTSLKGVMHLLPKNSMFCVLSQNHQHLLEKQLIYLIENCSRNSKMALKY